MACNAEVSGADALFSCLADMAQTTGAVSINMPLRLDVDSRRMSLVVVFIQKIITFTHSGLLMKIARNTLFVFACVTAALSVLTAAFVAHQNGLEAAAQRALQSALQMQQFHALAVLLLAWPAWPQALSKSRALAAALFVAGMLCFSFNIELHHLAGIDALRPLTPWGGMAFVLGWVVLAFSLRWD